MARDSKGHHRHRGSGGAALKTRLESTPAQKGKRNRRGITNAQAEELGALMRELGQPYTGSGMTFEQAATAIASARASLGIGVDAPIRRKPKRTTSKRHPAAKVEPTAAQLRTIAALRVELDLRPRKPPSTRQGAADAIDALTARKRERAGKLGRHDDIVSIARRKSSTRADRAQARHRAHAADDRGWSEQWRKHRNPLPSPAEWTPAERERVVEALRRGGSR